MNHTSSMVLWVLLASAAASASGATPTASSSQTDAAAQRERIARERAAAQAALAREEAACQERFLVTPCIDAARKTEREVLARLRREEVLLDEHERRQRAADRMEAIRNSSNPEAARGRKEPATAASAPSQRVERPDRAEMPGRAQRRPRELPVAPPPVDPAARRAAEQESAERYAADKRAAQAHREAVERRNAERAASGKVVAPLPPPSGASSSP